MTTEISQPWLIAIVGWLGCIIAFGIAWWRWGVGQRVQRAEFLDRLICRFKEINYDEYLRMAEQPSNIDQDNGELIDDGIRAYDFLVFLNYVCYLKGVGVIDDTEFLSFRCYVDRALRIGAVQSYLFDFHAKNHMTMEVSPYTDLLRYGRKEVDGVDDLCTKIESSRRTNPMQSNDKSVKVVGVDDGKTYRTHLEILNGIFNKGLLQHARGGSPLDENTSVWFPHIYRDRATAEGKIWYNTLSEDGFELREHCMDAKRCFGGQVDGPKVRHRYVFAKFMDGDPNSYRFIGIFDFKTNEPSPQNEICWLFVRTADSFDPKAIK